MGEEGNWGTYANDNVSKRNWIVELSPCGAVELQKVLVTYEIGHVGKISGPRRLRRRGYKARRRGRRVGAPSMVSPIPTVAMAIDC